MAAIAAYLLPQNTASARWNAFAVNAFNSARPYVLSLSQWQKWDIFSPDPLRRVSEYSVDVNEAGGWRTLKTLSFQTIPAYERAKELKILSRLEDNWQDMSATFLRGECEALPETAGRQLRLTAHSFILPKELHELTKFSDAPRQMTDKTLGTYQCPA
ncbi:MAG TPA: hypothetical protein PKV72_06110 [Candidatus Peribacteria bacterium]|nr:hypothetical protein [Candidatus Peribacteria bacterium]